MTMKYDYWERRLPGDTWGMEAQGGGASGLQ